MTDPTILISINTSWNIVNFRGGLVQALREHGYRVVAATPHDDFTPRLDRLGVEHVPISIDQRGTSPVRDLALLASYFRILRQVRPSLYLGYTAKPNIYGSLAAHALDIPVINNVAGLGETFMKKDWLNRLVRVMYKAALTRSRRVFFQNSDDRDLFTAAGIVRPGNTGLLPGSGIDLERFAPVAKPAGEEVRFLLVARLLAAKGIGEYVEAARRLRPHFPNVRWQIAGILEEGRSGAVPASALRGWEAEGLIDYLGALEDVRPAIGDADALVLPSYYPEGTPRSLLEGAAMGKPLITCDLPGCRNVVRDGVSGYLCAPRDAASLAEAMRRLLGLADGDRAAMGRASRRLAEECYDQRLVIDRYLAEIDGILTVNRPTDGVPDSPAAAPRGAWPAAAARPSTRRRLRKGR